MSPRDRVMLILTVGGLTVMTIGIVGLTLDDPQVAVTETPPRAETPTASQPTARPRPTTFRATRPTEVPTQAIAEFLFVFNEALGRGELDFAYDRLHPVALAMAGEERCRAYVTAEFADATAIALAGEIRGPTTVSKVGTAGTFEVLNRFTADVSLTVSGQEFAILGEYGVIDGQVYWFSTCV